MAHLKNLFIYYAAAKSESICSYHHVAPGSKPKHIYVFICIWIEMRKGRKYIQKGRFITI